MAMSDQSELGLADVKLPRASVEKARLITDLLERATSLGVVSEFLKAKGLRYSAGSWDEMHDKRIVPAIARQKLTFRDLTNLLADAEEYGRNHTFLFQGRQNDAKKLMDKNHVSALCKKLGQMQALVGTIVDLPPSPTLTEIREDVSNDQRYLVFKVVETREERDFLGETIVNNRVRREWAINQVRAVNVARLHESGFLEIRIQSHTNSTLYSADLNRMWTILKEYLPPAAFKPVSLSKAKKALWDSRTAKDRKIRFSDSIMRNDYGTTIAASTGTEQADLFKDSGASGSIDHFLDHGAYCDSENVWWLTRDRVTEREIHMLLSGQNHEFAITAACTRAEYEYVLNELRLLNR
jgi:hypothetical protein